MSMKIRVLALLIGFLFFMSGTILYPQYSSYFAKAQNSSIIQQAYKTYIPTTISKEAQEGLKNLKTNLVMVNPPQPEDFYHCYCLLS
jgi:hypothetical protein